jgi:heme/copper-type cytochrome/quinol oxidase subunit 4
MKSNKKIPPIVKIGAWVLALFVFAVGFWHTHLGLKEMKPFGSEWGGLVIASIVLLLLLITYWFAVNGRKMALIFYILCGVIFFICNLNYFYPAYMARTLIQNEASALNDTLQKYANGTSVLQGKATTQAIADYMYLNDLKSDVIAEISAQGFGPNARAKTGEFNSKASKYKLAPIGVSSAMGHVTNSKGDMAVQKASIEPLFKVRMNTMAINFGAAILFDPDGFIKGVDQMDNLQLEFTDSLNQIKSDNQTEYKLHSIRKYKNVQTIVNFVGKLNTIVELINQSNGKNTVLLKRLDEDTHPRADKLGMIKFTIVSIKERIKEIDTWAIIILCLFIDLVVPLAIYLLLRKKEDEPENKSLQGKIKPTSF